ncbi:MAG TPA: hypothetical protein VI685_12740, partial [Candidatus Angelobacter sp.]
AAARSYKLSPARKRKVNLCTTIVFFEGWDEPWKIPSFFKKPLTRLPRKATYRYDGRRIADGSPEIHCHLFYSHFQNNNLCQISDLSPFEISQRCHSTVLGETFWR